MAEKPPKFAEADGAPYIPAEYVISAGFINGLIQVNVGAQDLRSINGGPIEAIVTPSAHLRLTPWAAKELMRALKECLDLMKESEQSKVTKITALRQ